MAFRSFTETAIYTAAPDRVFAVLTDPELAPRIDPGIVYWRPEEDPIRVGTRNRLKVSGPLGITMRAVSEFVEYDPPHRFVLRSVRPRWPLKVTATAVLVPSGRATRLTYAVEFSGIAPAAALMCRTMQRNIQRGVALLRDQL